MAQHNATGRNHHPSKAERQAAMNPANMMAVASQVEKNAVVAKVEKKIDPNRGAATKARWSVCLKNQENKEPVLAMHVKTLPHDTLITSVVAGNPKKQAATARYELYGFNGKEGVSITIGAFLKSLGQRHSHALAFADIAWDVNHRFIKLTAPETAEPPAEEPAPSTEAVVEKSEEGGESSGEQVAA